MDINKDYFYPTTPTDRSRSRSRSNDSFKIQNEAQKAMNKINEINETNAINEINETNAINEINEINGINEEPSYIKDEDDDANMCEIINMDRLKIGKGAYSEVFRATYQGTPYALKYLNLPKIYEKNKMFYYGDFDKSKYLNTAYVLNIEHFLTKYTCSRLDDNILLLTDVFSFDAEFMIRGNDEMNNILLPYRGQFCIELLKAVDYMHRMNVMHLDLKPANILVKEFPPQIVLADFGGSVYNPFGKIMFKNFYKTCTPIYSPLYVIQHYIDKNNNFSFIKKHDIWSCGLIMAEFMLNILIEDIKSYPYDFERDLNTIYTSLEELEQQNIYVAPVLFLMKLMIKKEYYMNIESLPTAKQLLMKFGEYEDILSTNIIYEYEDYKINIDIFDNSIGYIVKLIYNYIADMPLYLFFMIIHNLIRLLHYYDTSMLKKSIPTDELRFLIVMCYKVYSFIDIPKFDFIENAINLELKLLNLFNGSVTQKTVFDYLKNGSELNTKGLYIFEPNTYFSNLNGVILNMGDSKINEDKYEYTFESILSVKSAFSDKLKSIIKKDYSIIDY